MKKVLIILVILIFYVKPVLASEIDTSFIDTHLDTFDLNEIEKIISESNIFYKSTSFKDLVIEAITGNLDLSIPNLFDTFIKTLFQEIYSNSNIMKQLLILVVLAALLKNLTESFKNKAVGELGFYVSYIAIVMYSLASFYIAISIVNNVIYDLSSVMKASMPFMMGLMIMSGSISSSYVFSPIILIVINIITIFIESVLSPAIILAAGLQIINYLTEKETLTNFAELVKDGCGLILKGISIVFISILSIQKISAPIMNNLALKTTRLTVGAIPVVGGILNGAVDTVIYFAGAVKSGSLVAIILVIVGMCVIPIIKLIAIIVIYKFLAAVIQPISDERVVKCLDTIGSYTIMLLGCLVIVMVMFIFSVMIMLSF